MIIFQDLQYRKKKQADLLYLSKNRNSTRHQAKEKAKDVTHKTSDNAKQDNYNN